MSITADESTTGELITSTPSVLDGKPRVVGRRLGVYFVATQVVHEGATPDTVATRYELPVEAVEAAVDYYYYYYTHPEEMGQIEAQRRERLVEAQADPSIPTTPEDVAEMVSESQSVSDCVAGGD